MLHHASRRELVKLVPTLLTVAFIFWLSRKISGAAMGGPGGPQAGGPGVRGDRVCRCTPPSIIIAGLLSG